MTAEDPFEDYPTSTYQFRGGALVSIPSAPVPRLDLALRRKLRDVLLDSDMEELGNCPRCTGGTRFGNARKISPTVEAVTPPVCTSCDRVDLWPVAA